MAVSTVAFRYANALLDLGQDKGLTETFYADMQLFKNTVEQSRQLMLMLKNPIVRKDKKNAVLTVIFKNRVNPVTMSFFQLIAQKHRESILDAIADEFIRLYNGIKGIQKATVVTTTPLTPELRQKFTAMVTKMTGATTVELDEKQDTKLIGGYVLRVGDEQVDASLRHQLNEMRLKFLN